mmetsp:Transcript_13175/g.52371  ORF Transcript_13175/g.52371 Transcript_13175/m.52371 type:complete len:97 (+) Transcript_13175:4126-4416(+)
MQYNSVLEYAAEQADRKEVQWTLLSSCGYLSGRGRRSFQSLLGQSASIDKFFASLLSIYTGDRAVRYASLRSLGGPRDSSRLWGNLLLMIVLSMRA